MELLDFLKKTFGGESAQQTELLKGLLFHQLPIYTMPNLLQRAQAFDFQNQGPLSGAAFNMQNNEELNPAMRAYPASTLLSPANPYAEQPRIENDEIPGTATYEANRILRAKANARAKMLEIRKRENLGNKPDRFGYYIDAQGNVKEQGE